MPGATSAAPQRSRGKTVATVATLLLMLSYPFATLASRGRLSPMYVAALLVLLGLLRAAMAKTRLWRAACVGAASLGAMAVMFDGWLPLKLYPVLVNATLLVGFALSLRGSQSAIERIARIREPLLPPSGVRYTRRVTQAWCVFFLVNGAVASWTAVFETDEVWALYNGLVAYLLMGMLFGIEWLVRSVVRQRTGERGSAAPSRTGEVADA
ncbi:hypothetical protein BH09PSE5_BH09PSE5_39740 [soil metagenome]